MLLSGGVTLGIGGTVAVAGDTLSLLSSSGNDTIGDGSSYRDARPLRCVLPERRDSQKEEKEEPSFSRDTIKEVAA